MPYESEAECKRLLSRYQSLKNDRQKYLAHWKDCQRLISPDHGRGLSGDRTGQEDLEGCDAMGDILDSTATAAVDVGSAGLQSGMTNPSRPWVKVVAEDPLLDSRPDVRSWCYIVSQRINSAFGRTNLYSALHQTYGELLTFGTGCILQLEDFRRVMRFRALTAGEYYLATNSQGEVDTLYRDIWMTATQLVKTFGEANVSDNILRVYKQPGGTETRFQVLHAIEPDDGTIPQGDAPPTVNTTAPRWFRVGNQVYGKRNPGRIALPDVKQLQKETEKKLIGLDKLMDPPTVSNGTPSDMAINTFPGGHTWDTGSGGAAGEGMRPLYQINLPLDKIMLDIAQLQNTVRERFFNNLFIALTQAAQSGRMTAREVEERHSEKLQILGPAVNNIETELLRPLVENAIEILWDAGLLPPPPEDLQAAPFKVEFDGLLSQAQKLAGIGALEQFGVYAGSLAGIKPDVLDKLDGDAMLDEYAKRTGVPPSFIVSDEEVLKVRERRAQTQQSAAALAAGQQGADTAKTLAETSTGGNTALSTLLGALPGGAASGQPTAGR